MIVPAAAQQGQPNPNQAAAKAILQAADKAIGASNVKSYIASSTGWMGYPGQQFAEGDLPRSDLKSNVRTVDFASKSAKTDYVRVQGNNTPRGGGAGFPVQGEQRFTEVVNGNTALERERARPARPGSRPPTPGIASSPSGPTRSASSRLAWRPPMRRPPTGISAGKTAPSKSSASTSKSAMGRNRNAPAG